MNAVPPKLENKEYCGILGEGGMGVVYLYYDRNLDRKVAVKAIKERTKSENQRKRLKREAQALGRVESSPNVVKVYDWIELPNEDEDKDKDF
ncbi:MAG: protein kinase, partial [Myxococcales bacterium]|nr:protein kinase [Myxococcales bacterium]